MLFITIMFVVMGSALFMMGLHYLKLGQISKSWIPVKAKVLKKGTAMTRGTGGEVATHKYFVFYEYSVGGNTYQGSRMSFKPALIPTYKAREQYEGVTELTVYYDPKEPVHSVIEPGVDGSNYLTFFAALFFVSVGIANYVWG